MSILTEIVGRMDRAEWQAEVLQNQANNLGTHLDSLSQRYWSLEGRFEGRVGQINAMASSFPGLDSRLDALDEKLKAFEALHWDHVALVRRLGAIEDVLNASGDFATRTIEEGRGRPLLPFPGFKGQPEPCAEAS